MASIDWDAATASLASDGLPCSGGERRILLLSASLAAGIRVSLRDTVISLDDHNIARLLTAIRTQPENDPRTADTDNRPQVQRMRAGGPAPKPTMTAATAMNQLAGRVSPQAEVMLPVIQ